MVLNLTSENRSVKNNNTPNIKTTEISLNVKDQVLSTLVFDDIEFITFIRSNLSQIIIDKNTGKVDLSKFVFNKIKKYLEGEFHEYISHPNFKKIIMTELSLEWEYKIFFDEKIKKFELINITDDRRFKWISAKDVNILINNILNLQNEEDIEQFLNEVIYWVDISIEKYIWEWFNHYIFWLIHNKIKLIIEKKDYSINKKWKTTDEQNNLFSNAMASKIYRDHFEYTNLLAWHKLLSGITEIILSEILNWNNWGLEKPINKKINKTVSSIKNIKENKSNNLNDLESILKNDELIIFQEKIKLYFSKFYNTNINHQLLTWAIFHLIKNNNIKLNTNDLINSIFSISDENYKQLINIFSKYNNISVIEDWGEYFYEKFNIRDLNKDKWWYNIEKIFTYIRKVVLKKEQVYKILKTKSQELKISEFQQYHYEGSINKWKKSVLELEKKVEESWIILKWINKEIEELNNKKWHSIIWYYKQNELIKLEEKKDIVMKKTFKLMRELDSLIVSNESLYRKLYKDIINLKAEVDDLKKMDNKLASIYNRLKEDFTRTLLFGRRKINN